MTKTDEAKQQELAEISDAIWQIAITARDTTDASVIEPMIAEVSARIAKILGTKPLT